MSRRPTRIAAWALSLSIFTLPGLAETTAPAQPYQAEWASPEALDLLTGYGIELTDDNRAKLLALDRKSQAANGQLDPEELDLSGDYMVTRKEVQYALSWSREQLNTEGRYPLSVQPRLLPNRTISGTIQLQANNPEQIRDPGLLFDSARLKESESLHLGIGDQSDFEVYAYVNYHPFRNAWADKPGPDGQPLQTAWYLLALHNPADNPPVEVSLTGSGLVNDGQSPHALQMLATLPPETSAVERAAAAGRILHATRSMDADLQERALTGQDQAIEATRTIAPGKSLLVYRALPLKSSGDFRGQYNYSVTSPGPLKTPLHFQTAVVNERPYLLSASIPVNEGVWSNYSLNQLSPNLQGQLSRWVEPKADGKTEFLKPASDLSSPQALAAELRTVQLAAVQSVTQDVQALWDYLDGQLEGRTLELPAILRKGNDPIPALAALKAQNQSAANLLGFWITPDELSSYATRLTELADKLDAAPRFDETLMAEVRSWNAELKMIPRVLAQPDQVLGRAPEANLKAVLKAFEHRFWTTLVALGRINGVVPGQVIRSNLPSAELVFQPEDERREWNFLLISNPLNTGGVLTAPEPPLVESDETLEPEADPETEPDSEAEIPADGDDGEQAETDRDESVPENSPALLAPYAVTDGARIDSMPMRYQSAHTLMPPPVDYGHYGVRYVVTGTFANDSGVPSRLDIRFGSTDEMGHLDWHSLFDHSDSLMGDASTRFTGTIRLRTQQGDEPARSQLVSIVHGRVQAPQSLLADPLRLEPGEQREISVELVVPTNSTGPQLLQFKMEKAR